MSRVHLFHEKLMDNSIYKIQMNILQEFMYDSLALFLQKCISHHGTVLHQHFEYSDMILLEISLCHCFEASHPISGNISIPYLGSQSRIKG